VHHLWSEDNVAVQLSDNDIDTILYGQGDTVAGNRAITNSNAGTAAFFYHEIFDIDWAFVVEKDAGIVVLNPEFESMPLKPDDVKADDEAIERLKRETGLAITLSISPSRNAQHRSVEDQKMEEEDRNAKQARRLQQKLKK
jgi:hypothetical protein